MVTKRVVIFGCLVAFATAAIELNPSRPLLFGTNRIIPEVPLVPDVESVAVWNELPVRQSHSNAQNRNFFPMRYVSNDKYYQPGGPIFLFVGGPWELREHFVEQGHFVDIAANMSAYLVANELRYYGESIPVEDATRHNLRYLALTQILPDIASLIAHIRDNVLQDPRARVILGGVGFSGSLAQWTRKSYPHLVQGVWSSSGMSFASNNFSRFAQEVGGNIRAHGGDECYNAIWQGFGIAENLIDAGLSETVDRLFNVCNPIDAGNPFDVEAFFNGIFNEITLQATTVNLRENIARMCEVLTSPDQPNAMTALSDWLTSSFGNAECLVMDFESIVETYLVTDWQDEMLRNGERQWLFQRCTSMGWPLTADSLQQPFGSRISVNFFQELCSRLFDEWLTPDVFRSLVRDANLFFGGNQPDVQRVYFSHGAQDPWRYVAVRSVSGDAFSRQTANATHGEDLASISDADSDALRQSKELIAEALRRWAV
ncbi:thymus-specific serine protease-like [Sabethes cyaneus]|uniref:thymus-specific serine protease-like n=1 Tax=Sabethes cyaneus TaxID=53552 RepID=UPI00237D34C0|nr:thymus-specific serine protease-like [Sabethes cyaneus]